MRLFVLSTHIYLCILASLLMYYSSCLIFIFHDAGFKDRHYFSEPRLFHSKITPRSGELASDVLLNRHEGHQQHHHHQHQHRSGYKGSSSADD